MPTDNKKKSKPSKAEQTKPYRPNVAAIVVNNEGRIALGRKPGTPECWQFPQGGVDDGEDELKALYRELWEELGIKKSQLQVLESISGFRYDYHPDHSRAKSHAGQEQTIYHCHYSGRADRVDLTISNEFCEMLWFSPDEIRLDWFPENKRHVARQALNAFVWRKVRSIPLSEPSKLEHSFTRSMETPVTDRYIIKPGSKIDLREISTRDRALFDGSKEDSLPVFDELRNQLREEQKKLFAENKHRVLVIIQAMDTGGKDGLIKHVFSRVDPQGVEVAAFKKPTEHELAHDFLWRVHQKVPRNGMITIFNRSHYEDIIAVRVKKIYEDAVWKRRYQHVLDFERMLSEEGTKIIKLFLHISKKEQKERLVARLENPNKHWKFLPEDLEDRARWSEFESAYSHLISKTSTKFAPWHVIPADRKWYRNYSVAKLMLEQLDSLNLRFPEIDFDPTKIVVPD